MVIKVLVAAVLGFLIGVERKGGKKGAGTRTFSLICMGSALFTVLSVVAFEGPDNSRIAAQIVTGIGFIGGGVIWRSSNDIVHGITTAAAIWVSAAIGISVGVGYFLLALVTTLTVIVILAKGHPIKCATQNLLTGDE